MAEVSYLTFFSLHLDENGRIKQKIKKRKKKISWFDQIDFIQLQTFVEVNMSFY